MMWGYVSVLRCRADIFIRDNSELGSPVPTKLHAPDFFYRSQLCRKIKEREGERERERERESQRERTCVFLLTRVME